MREIKFRCRDKEAEWMFEFNLLDEEWYNEKLGTIPLDESQVIMQYIWLKDKNWMDIYEGDIVTIYPIDWPTAPYQSTVVRSQEYAWFSFKWENWCTWFPWVHGSIEVIGNIYETSELLK